MTDKALQDMIEPELWERAMPFYDLTKGSSSSLISDSKTTQSSNNDDYIHQPRMVLSESGAAVPNQAGWPLVEASMLVACGGITRFCLDTMDAQFDVAFQSLLDLHFNKREHLDDYSVERADDQLRLGSLSVTGYFSLKERHARIEKHFEELRSKFS
mmetsp:Transcript_27256/g.58577  ORF Transcript_27256/g.58577 Transcript_27256/m.58577 type:complete len:157 (-) Transcript_27256:197-667(-)